jgi:methylated-DNA-[protein]-cysteine S-methyltransferase
MRSAVDGRISRGLNAEFIESDAPLLRETKRQLDEYFRAERKRFELPLLMVGSDFQKSVWDELLNVEYGETASYLGLAERMGNKNAVRAVAGANGANAISIIVPCHRIIGGKGELVGYAGGLNAKEKLLALECGLFALR